MKIACCQLDYKIGDFDQNVQKILHAIDANQQNDLIVFSELCLSGYYPMDLIDKKGFFEAQQLALNDILTKTKAMDCAIVLGVITKNADKGKPFHNSLIVIHQGSILYTYHKQLLPTYNIFDESRHFAPGNQPGLFSFKGKQLGFLICAEGWAEDDKFGYQSDPVKALENKAIDIIIAINGSPSNLAKQTERLARFTRISKRCDAPLLFSNQVGGNDDIVFDGYSFLVNNTGKLIGTLPPFQEASGSFTLDNHITTNDFKSYTPLSDVALCYQQILLGLTDYVKKCGFKGVVVSLSGGIDSALTLSLTAKTLPASSITALTMPSRYSSKESVTDSQALCDTLGIQLYTIPIDEEFSLALNQFEKAFGEKPSELTAQNMQARIRGRILMEYSNQTGYLVLTPGNKSELSVGYATLYGDMSGGLNIVGDLYKTDVYRLAQYFNEHHPNTLIPPGILTKAPSAELAPNQRDTDSLPPYDVLDPIIKLYIEGDLLPDVERQSYEAILQHIDTSLIDKVHNMVDKAEFKRRQAPPIIRVQRRAFGFGRQLPIAASYPKCEGVRYENEKG